MNIAERYTTRISDAELARRWERIRTEMGHNDLDCLIFSAYDNMLGGYFRYVTDLMIADYPMTVLFPKDSDMCLIGHGGVSGTCMSPDFLRGVASAPATPMMPTLWYTDHYVPELIKKEIQAHNYKRVGIVAMATMPASTYLYLTEQLPDVEFVNATDMVDRIKAIKSPEELQRLRQTVKIHDQICAAVPAFFRPGRVEFELTADIRKLASDLGAECIVNVGLGTDPVMPPKLMVPMQHRIIQEHDLLFCLIEVSGPGGLYSEISHMWSLGEPSEAMRKASDTAVQAARLVEAHMRPGVPASELLRVNNEYLVQQGYAPEERLFGHGQGYDMVERPAFVEAETMCLEKDMFVTAHPGAGNGSAMGVTCNSYIITEDGFEKLTQTPDGIIVC